MCFVKVQSDEDVGGGMQQYNSQQLHYYRF